MKKIPTLFRRNYITHHVENELASPELEWVISGQREATRKWDGTCCMVRDGKLWKRYELKKDRVAPLDFEEADAVDPITGDTVGWVPVDARLPQDVWHREAFSKASASGGLQDGTYELCGPKIQGNPEFFDSHVLVRHGNAILVLIPRTFDGLKEYLFLHDIEGIVWYHKDGRMAKIKGKDFGLKRTKCP
ncbi:MAG: hypothetical protein ACREBU_00805 [Nitrososphaera sp.]